MCSRDVENERRAQQHNVARGAQRRHQAEQHMREGAVYEELIPAHISTEQALRALGHWPKPKPAGEGPPESVLGCVESVLRDCLPLLREQRVAAGATPQSQALEDRWIGAMVLLRVQQDLERGVVVE